MTMRTKAELAQLLEWIREELDHAIQSDHEHGVAWMNEESHKKFARDYPAHTRAINEINTRIDDALEDPDC